MKLQRRGDAVFEGWWNLLTSEMRCAAFQIVPLRNTEQIRVFSGRRWHELHAWMRDDLRKIYNRTETSHKTHCNVSDIIS